MAGFFRTSGQWAVGIACCVALWGYAAGAHAQTIDDAKALYLAADFPGALRSFEAVLASPSLTRGDAAESHRYLATLRALFGDQTAARAHARAAIALEPSAFAPEGAPPSVSVMLDEARQEYGGRRAEITFDLLPGRERTRVRVRVSPAPEGLAKWIKVRCEAPEHNVVEERSAAVPSVSLEWTDTNRPAHCVASVRTESDAVLFEATQELTPLTQVPRGALDGDHDDDDGPAVWPWIVGGGVAVAAGIVAVVLLTSSSGEANFRSVSVEGW